MSDQENKGSVIHNINDMDQFAQFLSSSGFFMMDPLLSHFYDNYMGINKGCSCGKKKKIQATKAIYMRMDDIAFGTKQAMRASLEVNEVNIKDGETLITSF